MNPNRSLDFMFVSASCFHLRFDTVRYAFNAGCRNLLETNTNMIEASLLALIFDVAFAVVAQVKEHFREYAFHGLVPSQQRYVGVISVAKRQEAVVCNVNSCAIAVARVGGGILVSPLEA